MSSKLVVDVIESSAGALSINDDAGVTGTLTADDFVSSGVTITGGNITDITDLALADGGTGASSAADARTNLDVDQAGTALAMAIALG